MSNLRVDCRVVPSPAEVGTVALVGCIINRSIGEPAGKEDGQPLVVDDVLVGGDGELTSTVKQPLILLVLLNTGSVYNYNIINKTLSPIYVYYYYQEYLL